MIDQDTRRTARTVLAAHYADLISRYGDRPQSVQWRDRATQDQRLAVLCQIGDVARAGKILDLGCGTCRLYEVLLGMGFSGEYVGYDIAEPMLEAARRKFPNTRLDLRDVVLDGINEDFDYILASGVFNNRISNNWSYMTETLKAAFPRARTGFAFNCISTFVDRREPHLWYADPLKVFSFCKSLLSPSVTLRHDYQVRRDTRPYEFSVYIYASPFAPVKPIADE